MQMKRFGLAVALAAAIAVATNFAGCSREQSDWEKAHAANNAEAYELFVKKYPNGTFAGQAQARLKELYEERDWQKARDTDTPEAYQAFLKQYPEGKWTEEARIRLENFTLAQVPGSAPSAAGGTAPSAVTAPADGSATPPGAKSGTATAMGAAAAGAVAVAAAANVKPAVKPAAPVKSAAAAKPSASAKESTSAAKGAYAVQLGAFKTGDAAAKHLWARLKKHHATALKGLTPTIRPPEASTGNFYRLQVTGLSAAHAERLCKQLKAGKSACLVVEPKET